MFSLQHYLIKSYTLFFNYFFFKQPVTVQSFTITYFGWLSVQFYNPHSFISLLDKDFVKILVNSTILKNKISPNVAIRFLRKLVANKWQDTLCIIIKIKKFTFVDFLQNLETLWRTARYNYITWRYKSVFAKKFTKYALTLTAIRLTKHRVLNGKVFFFKLNTWFWVFYKGCKTLFLPVFIALFLGVILIDYYNLNIVRQAAVWAVVGLLFFWLFSGFNFFLKRYRFGKFTSAIQRFWKRTNTYFWLIEGFLFSLFFYYYLNSSQEVYYFFDEAGLNQTYLISLFSWYSSTIWLFVVIFYSFYVLLNLPNFVFKQLLLHLKLITVLMVWIFLLECYQFYYVITGFFELIWVYNPSENSWVLDWQSPKVRVKHQYFFLALIAKYWHFLFIFFSWLFVVMKGFEQKRVHYTLFGVNVQNCILLLLLNSLFYLGWIKWLLRRYWDTVYFWFFTDLNNWVTSEFFGELVNCVTACVLFI